MRHQPSRERGRAGDDPADIVGHAGGTAEGGLSGGARTAARELLALAFGEEQLPGEDVDPLMLFGHGKIIADSRFVGEAGAAGSEPADLDRAGRYVRSGSIENLLSQMIGREA